MVSICQYVLHWPGAVDAIIIALHDYFPADMVAFIKRNLMFTVNSRGPMQIGSILLLFFTANGVFEPMEVALNRAWGIHENRSFLKNQIVSMGLIFLCGGLVLLSIVFTAANRQMLEYSPLAQWSRRRRTHSDFIQNGSNSDHNADVVPDLLAAPEPAFAVAERGAGIYLCRTCAGRIEVPDAAYVAISARKARA